MSLIRQINIEDDIGYLWPFMPSADNNPLFYKLMIDGFFFIFTNFVEYSSNNYLKLPGAKLFTLSKSSDTRIYKTTDTILTEQSKWFWDKVFIATSKIHTGDWEYYYSKLLYEEITDGSIYNYIDFNANVVDNYEGAYFIAAVGGII